MPLVEAGNWQLNQAQQGLSAAASNETSRNIANKNIKQQNEADKAGLGASIGSAAGAIAGSYFGPAGTMAGGALGSVVGSFASKLF